MIRWSSEHMIQLFLVTYALLEVLSLDAVVIQPPVRKTTYTSEVARQKTSAPLVFDTQSDKFYSFCRWSPLLEQLDLVPFDEWQYTPAFRMGGPLSAAL